MKMSANLRRELEYALAALARFDPGDCQSILKKVLGYDVQVDEFGDPVRK